MEMKVSKLKYYVRNEVIQRTRESRVKWKKSRDSRVTIMSLIIPCPLHPKVKPKMEALVPDHHACDPAYSNMGFSNSPDVTQAKVDRENGCIIVDMEKLNTLAYIQSTYEE